MEWWVTDGFSAGTELLFANPSGWLADIIPVVAGDRLFFPGWDEDYGAELWMSDGTPGGTGRLTDMYPGSQEGPPYMLTVWQGDLYFVADMIEYGYEIHVIRDVVPVSARDALDNWAEALAQFRAALSIASEDLGGNGLPD